MKTKENNRGITLVALVVTIVVLLILAGVSINLVIGQNGIITKAQEAKEKYEQVAINEEIERNKLYNEIVEYLDDNTSTEEDVEPLAVNVKNTGRGESTATVTVEVTNEKPEGSDVTVSYYIKLSSDTDDNYQQKHTGKDLSYTFTDLSYSSSYTIKIEVTDASGRTATTTTTAGTWCFLAGTQVLTESGMKNIEDIEIGEKVYAINMENNQKELKEVTELFRGTTDEVYELTIGDEVIKTTPKHQFYVVDKGWVRAYDLQEGDRIDAKDNESLVITKIEHKFLEEPVPVYNLTVEGYHNYLITQYELLVHNAGSK